MREGIMLQESIKKLVQYGIDCGLTPECERIYTTNLLLECFNEDEYTDPVLFFSHYGQLTTNWEAMVYNYDKMF